MRHYERDEDCNKFTIEDGGEIQWSAMTINGIDTIHRIAGLFYVGT